MKNIWKNRNWTPMLLKEEKTPFNSKDHLFELKYDGIRALIFGNKKELKIQSRHQQDLTLLFPELQEIKKILHTNTIFDGEIISMEQARPSFSKIQTRLHIKNNQKIKLLSKKDPVIFMAFDILYEKKDLTTYPLLKRKEYLKLYPDNDYFIKTKVIENDGIHLFKSVQNLSLEGIVAKSKTGTYHINERTTDFIKIKNIQRDEFYIGGYLEKKNGILSLALGEYMNQKFYYVGKVSIGQKNKKYGQIKKLQSSKNYFVNYSEPIHYVKPTITCQIAYLERTKNNHLRHPIWQEQKEES
jgi:ATP-dependent DNA ligase